MIVNVLRLEQDKFLFFLIQMRRRYMKWM